MMFNVEMYWMFMLLPVLGLFSALGGNLAAAFSGADFDDAVQVLREQMALIRPTIDETREERRALTARGEELLDEPSRLRPDVERAREQLFAPTGGLSPATEIAFEDALRILDERLVLTGNLRSSTSVFQASQLGERTIAAELERQLGIAATFGDLDLRSRLLDQQILNLALGFGQLELGALQQSTALAGGISTVNAAQTALDLQQDIALGTGIGTIADLALIAATAGAGGAGAGAGGGAGAGAAAGFGGSVDAASLAGFMSLFQGTGSRVQQGGQQ